MSQIAERYIHLCRSYIQLSEKFQKLDVEHTTLRRNIVPLLDNLKTYKQVVEALEQEKSELEENLRIINEKYERLKQYEILEQPDIQAELSEAESQIALVEETIQEMEENQDPDLNKAEKMLLNEYQSNPKSFELLTPAPSPEYAHVAIQNLASERNLTVNEAAIHTLKKAFQADEVSKVREKQIKTQAEILEKIRSRPRVNPLDFGLLDSTVLIREDRDR